METAIVTGSNGAYHAGENHVSHRGRLARDGAKRGVITVGGLGSLAKDAVVHDDVATIMRRAGIIGASFDIVDGKQWANAASVTRMEDAWAFCKSTLGFKNDKVILYGASHGLSVCLAFARAHPGDVAAIMSVIGATDIQNIYLQGGTNAASIDAAYGGNWAANEATRNPIHYASELAAIPQLMMYSGDDPIVVPSTSQAFAAAVGANATLINMGNFGHASNPDPALASQLAEFAKAHA